MFKKIINFLLVKIYFGPDTKVGISVLVFVSLTLMIVSAYLIPVLNDFFEIIQKLCYWGLRAWDLRNWIFFIILLLSILLILSIIYRPDIVQRIKLKYIKNQKELFKAGLYYQVGDSYYKSLPKVTDAFVEFLSHSSESNLNQLNANQKELWEELLKKTIVTYNDSLSSIVTDNHILPATFNLYAECIQKILDHLMEGIKKDYNTEIIIYTVLRKGIAKWYNMGFRGGKVSQNYCPEWWLKYLEANQSFKEIIKEMKINKNIHINRLIEKDVSNEEELFIYSDEEGKAKCLKISEAKLIAENFKNKLTLYSPQDLFSFEDEDDMIYLIAKKINKTRNISRWKSLVQDFQQNYHSSHSGEIGLFKPGICYRYVDSNLISKSDFQDLNYADIFIIQFYDVEQANGFGLALSIDELKDISGIKLLRRNEMMESINQFKSLWEIANEKY